MSARSMEGLGPSPEPNYLHVDLGKDEVTGRVFPWHFYDFDSDRQEPVYEQSLTGRLTEIKIRKGTYKGKELFKIMFKVVAGRTQWYIRSGVETTFTRGVVLSLHAHKDEIAQLDDPPYITIHAKPGDTAVYGSVYWAESMSYMQREWDNEVPLLPIIQDLQKALGQEPQTLERIRAEYEQKQGRV